MKTLRITVTGRVQGVFFRKFTKEKADELGLTGEVRNMPNGSVIILATGTDQRLNQLLAWCYHGPVRAEVEGVNVESISVTAFPDFRISR